MASSFQDLRGDVWHVRFSIPFQRVVQKRTGISLPRLLSETTLRQLAEDDEKTLQLIWACFADQAKERNLSEDDFFGPDRCDPEVLELAVDAIFEAALDSLPKKNKPAAERILEILRGSGRMMTTKTIAAIDNLDSAAILQEIETAIDNHFAMLQPKTTKPTNTTTKPKLSKPKNR